MNKEKAEMRKRRRGRPLKIEWAETVEQLEACYRAEKDVRRRTRLHGLWLISKGKTLTEVSQLLSVPYRTVQHWVAYYREGQLAEVMRRTPGGEQKGGNYYLNELQERAVKAKANTGGWQTAAAAREWIRDRWGVSYTTKGIYSLLERLRINKKVPRRQSDKANVAEQEAWKKGGLLTP